MAQRGGGSTLDCAWLAGDNNCWRATADEAAACLPPTTETGVLSADGKTCTYASGAQVTFTPALVVPVPDNMKWNFTITNSGADCLHFESTNGFKLVVSGHTVTEGRSGAAGIQISCPDGTTYANANALALLGCSADAGIVVRLARQHLVNERHVRERGLDRHVRHLVPAVQVPAIMDLGLSALPTRFMPTASGRWLGNQLGEDHLRMPSLGRLPNRTSQVMTQLPRKP